MCLELRAASANVRLAASRLAVVGKEYIAEPPPRARSSEPVAEWLILRAGARSYIPARLDHVVRSASPHCPFFSHSRGGGGRARCTAYIHTAIRTHNIHIHVRSHVAHGRQLSTAAAAACRTRKSLLEPNGEAARPPEVKERLRWVCILTRIPHMHMPMPWGTGQPTGLGSALCGYNATSRIYLSSRKSPQRFAKERVYNTRTHTRAPCTPR